MSTPSHVTVNVPTDVTESAAAALIVFAEQAAPFAAIVKAYESDDATKLLVAMREQHERYAEVVALQDQIAEVLMAIDAENAPKVSKPTEAEYQSAAETLKSLRDQASSIINVLKIFGGDDYLDNVPDVLRPKRKARASNGDGTQKRPRVSDIKVFVMAKNGDRAGDAIWHGNRENEDSRVKSTFTAAAAAISKAAGRGNTISTEDLQMHAFGAAGTEDLSEHNGPFEFVVKVGDGNYIVTVTP